MSIMLNVAAVMLVMSAAIWLVAFAEDREREYARRERLKNRG